MPTYETLYIAQPDMAEADAEALGKSFEELVATGEGTLMKSAAWGKRKLAYLVNKHQEGLYFYLQFDAAPDVVAELERRLRNHEGILKYLSVRLDRIAIETLAAADKKAEERAAARAVREAERAERQKLAEEEAAAAQEAAAAAQEATAAKQGEAAAAQKEVPAAQKEVPAAQKEVAATQKEVAATQKEADPPSPGGETAPDAPVTGESDDTETKPEDSAQ